jgi:hypothetical protein
MKVTSLLLLLAVFFSIGCADGALNANPRCFITGMNVSPATATIDHTAAPPANSQQFAAFQTSAPSGCAFALSNLQTVTWTLSDPVNASISNTHDATYGRATCINAAPAPITVTGTVPAGNGSNVTATAALTCN